MAQQNLEEVFLELKQSSGTVLELLRTARELSREELSTALKIDLSYLEAIESGEKIPSLEEFIRISKFLKYGEISFILLRLIHVSNLLDKCIDNPENEFWKELREELIYRIWERKQRQS